MTAALAEWIIEGVARCPGDCGLYLDFHGTPAELRQFISAHDCIRYATAGAQQPCRAHPDDCPNGPEPHAYYNPPEFEGRPPCCRQPGEPETPPGELLEELF